MDTVGGNILLLLGGGKLSCGFELFADSVEWVSNDLSVASSLRKALSGCVEFPQISFIFFIDLSELHADDLDLSLGI